MCVGWSGGYVRFGVCWWCAFAGGGSSPRGGWGVDQGLGTTSYLRGWGVVDPQGGTPRGHNLVAGTQQHAVREPQGVVQGLHLHGAMPH